MPEQKQEKYRLEFHQKYINDFGLPCPHAIVEVKTGKIKGRYFDYKVACKEIEKLLRGEV